MPLSFPVWPSASFFSTSLVEEAVRPDFLRLFIPSNPFYSFANSVIPAIVVFSILVGITLIDISGKQAFLDPLLGDTRCPGLGGLSDTIGLASRTF